MAYANRANEQLLQEYTSWTGEALNAMGGHVEALLAGQGERAQVLEEIFGIAHNIKGMGATFGFPLMTELGTSLCNYLRTRTDDPATVSDRVVNGHFRSMRMVFDENIQGDGGESGRQLLARLKDVIAEESDQS